MRIASTIAAVGLVLATALRPDPLAAAQSAAQTFSVEVTGSGAPMLLIPGLSCTGEVWASTVERFRDRYQLHVLTLAGFGGPAPIGPPFLSRVRDGIIEYIRSTRLTKPVLVGHSLGGFLAFWVASTTPDLIGGVIAVDGVPFLPALANPVATGTAFAPQADAIRAMYAGLSRDALVAESRKALTTMITAPADVERAAEWAAKSDAATVGQAVAEMMTTDLRDRVSAISAPTLLIGALGGAPAAMHDLFKQAYTAQVANVPGARVVAAMRARHFVMLDDPAFLFATMDEFLGGLAKTGGR